MPDRTDPGAVRGPTDCPAQILALAPAHGVGRTARAAPTLYWHLPEPTACRVEFVLNDPRSPAPRVEETLMGPHAAGAHAIHLSEFGVELEFGVVYTWFIQLVPDPDARSKDVFAGGPLERVTSNEPAWYDVMAKNQDRLAAKPDDPAVREALAQMLAAEGLEGVARQIGPRAPDVAAGPDR
jgi:hypothetical protein